MDLIFDILLAGQSNVDRWFAAENSQALVVFEETFLEENPRYTAVRFYDAARGGSAMLASSARASVERRTNLSDEMRQKITDNHWYDDMSGALGFNYQLFSDDIRSWVDGGVSFDAVIWAQGESEISYLSPDEDGLYLHAMETVLRALLKDTGAPTVYIQALGDRSYFKPDDATDLIRSAQSKLADAQSWAELATTVYDLPLQDSVHLSAEGFQTAAHRMALAIASGRQSLAPVFAKLSGDRITLGFEIPRGHRIVPRVSAFGFSARSGDTELKILEVDVTDEKTVELILAGSPRDVGLSYAGAELSYAMGAEDTLFTTDGKTELPVFPFSFHLVQTANENSVEPRESEN